MSYQPRILEKFESSDGVRSVTFPVFAYEYESEQSLRTPEAPITGADYAVDLLGTAPGVKNSATERLRFVNYQTTPTAVDTAYDDMRRDLLAIGLGKLYSIDSAGVRRWAWARITDMPQMAWRAGDIFKQAISLGFRRQSDWFSTTERVYQFDLGSDNDTFRVQNNGNGRARFMEWRLRSQANFRLTSGTAITDATRRAALSGDGRTTPDSSVGIWLETTNLVSNGGFETNTTGWSASGTNTVARSTEQAKFGTASLKCTYQDNASMALFTVVMTDTDHSGSFWLYVPTAWDGGTLTCQFVGFTSMTGTLTASANMALRDQWQRIEVPGVNPDAADLTGSIRLVQTGAAPTAGRFAYIDGVQVAALPACSPYVETDGGTATRSKTVIETPVTDALFTETQGWAAFRLRMGFGATQTPNGSDPCTLMDWQDDTDNRLWLYYDVSTDDFRFRRRNTSGTSETDSAAQTFVKDDKKTVIAAWTATTVKISVDGGAFVSVANTTIPTLSSILAKIGAKEDGDNGQINSDVMWAAFGTGTLTDADATTIHAFGDTDPSLDEFGTTPACSRVWTGDGIGSGTTYYTNPKIVNTDNDDEFSTTRDSTATGDELKVDTELNTVERSTDDGGTYANDYSLFSVGASQVGFMELEEGENAFRYDDGGTPNLVAELRFYEAHT